MLTGARQAPPPHRLRPISSRVDLALVPMLAPRRPVTPGRATRPLRLGFPAGSPDGRRLSPAAPPSSAAWLPTTPGDIRNAALRETSARRHFSFLHLPPDALSDLGLPRSASGPPDDTPGPPSGPRPAPPLLPERKWAWDNCPLRTNTSGLRKTKRRSQSGQGRDRPAEGGPGAHSGHRHTRPAAHGRRPSTSQGRCSVALSSAHRPGSSRGDGPGHVHRGSSGVGLGPPAAPGAISAPRCSAAARRGVGGGQRSLSDSACATPRPSATSHRLTEHCHGKAERKDRAVKPFHAQLSARRGAGAAAHAPATPAHARGPRTHGPASSAASLSVAKGGRGSRVR